jgi:hypothetical protein
MKMTAYQLANVLQRSKRTIHRLSKEHQWPFTEKIGIGGPRKIYDITQLPQETKRRMIDNILRQLGRNTASVNEQDLNQSNETNWVDHIDFSKPSEDYWAAGNIIFHRAPPLTAAQLAEQPAIKKALLSLAWAYITHTGQKKVKGFEHFIQQYKARLLPIQPSVYQSRPKVAAVTLLRWDYANIQSGEEKNRLLCNLSPVYQTDNTTAENLNINQVRQQKLITLLSELGFDTQNYLTNHAVTLS